MMQVDTERRPRHWSGVLQHPADAPLPVCGTPARLYPAAAPTAAPVQRVGPASQAYCVLPWLMMTSGQLGGLPLVCAYSPAGTPGWPCNVC